MNAFWQRLSNGARTGLIGGTMAIVLLTAVLGWWLLRPDYQVLFADLKPQDASAMTTELERLKIPYKISDSGSAILVDRAVVHTTRIKLMGKDIPLHGAVGFELFNNTDFGMTEFAQKINFQRALQGELTRTILALSEIRDVRVHLAMPEQGLFKQATSRTKAAITITLRQGQVLRNEQVLGIQRLVAAAVPGMTSQDVTIVDNQGIALSRLSASESDTASSSRLDLKKEIETYLTRKVSVVLERTFGAGVAVASVDVTLNMDQVKVTTEDVVGVPSKGTPTGVVVRERESSRDSGAPLDAKTSANTRGGNSTQREVDYQVGRRVEQIVGQPGSIRRIQAVVVIPSQLDEHLTEQLRKTIAAAVGASLDRGDEVVIQQKGSAPASAEAATPPVNSDEAIKLDLVPTPSPESHLRLAIILLFAVLLSGFLGRLAYQLMRRNAPLAAQRPLTEMERQAALRQVKAWLDQGAMPSETSGNSPSLPTGGA